MGRDPANLPKVSLVESILTRAEWESEAIAKEAGENFARSVEAASQRFADYFAVQDPVGADKPSSKAMKAMQKMSQVVDEALGALGKFKEMAELEVVDGALEEEIPSD